MLADGRNQGPLRCSLARLAWEECAGAWGVRGGLASFLGALLPSAPAWGGAARAW